MIREPLRTPERSRPFGLCSRVTKLRQKITCGENAANVFLGERSPQAEHCRIVLDTPRGEWDVAGDDDIILPSMLDDPIVGCVGMFADHDEFEPIILRDAHPGIGYENYTQVVPSCDAVDLVLDGTAVRVYVNDEH